MNWRWLTKNWANTLEPTHPDVEPLLVPLPFDEAYRYILRVVEDTLPPRWELRNRHPIALIFVRRTRLLGFQDDVVAMFEPVKAGGTRIHASSRSRVGKGDLGQNRRNILELWQTILGYK